MHSWAMAAVIYPFYHRVKGDGLMPAIQQYSNNQWLSETELKKIQLAKLQNLLQHSRDNVPYYRDIFEESEIDVNAEFDYESFKRLPLLTKDVMRDEKNCLFASDFKKEDMVRSSTSGSTGEPLVFYNDRQSLMWRQAVLWRNQEWVHVKSSDKEAKLWGAQLDISKSNSIRGRISSWAHQTILLSTYDMSDDSMNEYVLRLRKFKPRLLVSYPGPLVIFAKYIQQHNISIPSIKSIITSAEQLHGWQRDIIQRVFGPILYDRYGSREFGNIAHECDEHNGYHLNMERFFIETIGSDGQPVAMGETGELVITDLDNYGFPFIRYQIGDLAVLADRVCPCGRGLTLVERFEGRSLDIISCPNGNRVAGTFWTIVMRKYSGIIQFQIEQLAIDNLIVRLRTDDKWRQESESLLVNNIKEKCGVDMKVSYEYVEKIDLTTSGKQRLVISRV